MSEHEQQYHIELRSFDFPFTKEAANRFFNHPSFNYFNTVEAATERIFDEEIITYRDDVRIVDEAGNVVAEFILPYEDVWIDITQPGRDWIEEIRDTYGVDADTWKQACQDWMEHH